MWGKKPQLIMCHRTPCHVQLSREWGGSFGAKPWYITGPCAYIITEGILFCLFLSNMNVIKRMLQKSVQNQLCNIKEFLNAVLVNTQQCYQYWNSCCGYEDMETPFVKWFLQSALVEAKLQIYFDIPSKQFTMSWVNSISHTQGSFCVCAQPMRDDVTL